MAEHTQILEKKKEASETDKKEAASVPELTKAFTGESEKERISGDKSVSENDIPKKKVNVFRKLSSFLFYVLSEKKKLLVFLGIYSLLFNYLLETAMRRNFITGLTHIIFQPHVFLYNSLIIFFSFTLILLAKRRIFFFSIISILWLALTVTNFVLLTQRSAPFNASDFRLVVSAVDIISRYLVLWQLVALIILIVAAFTALVIVFIKGKKSRCNWLFSGITIAVTGAITVLATSLYSSFYVKITDYSNLPEAFKKYGYTYSFLFSALDVGIPKPPDYSKQRIDKILDKIGEDGTGTDVLYSGQAVEASIEKPNVVFIQLESFYDPMNVSNYSYNTDPIPTFRKLMKEGMSGLLTVPSLGAGTANTGFEVLTGMDVDHFGITEYPYFSRLGEYSCESVAYDFKSYGYSAHILHNHIGSFYDRYKVFPHLGFDTFTPIETMSPIYRNENGWAKDSMLLKEIFGLLEHTENRADLIYAISVQAHGKYPDSKESFDIYYNQGHPASIRVTGNEDNPERYGFDYWVNQVYDVDGFIADLVSALENYDEPTVLVMFGDHLPAFDYEAWELKDGNLYQTQYVIWSNYDMKQHPDRDLYTFQLASYVMDILNIDYGCMNKLHKYYYDKGIAFDGSDEYYKDMWNIQYDVLYGERYLYGEKEKYKPSDIKFGYKNMELCGIEIRSDTVSLYCTGLNEYSDIYINGSSIVSDLSEANLDVSVIQVDYARDGNEISDIPCAIVRGLTLETGDEVKIVQSGEGVIFRESNTYTVTEKDLK